MSTTYGVTLIYGFRLPIQGYREFQAAYEGRDPWEVIKAERLHVEDFQAGDDNERFVGVEIVKLDDVTRGTGAFTLPDLTALPDAKERERVQKAAAFFGAGAVGFHVLATVS
jgi:hypothetical protein